MQQQGGLRSPLLLQVQLLQLINRHVAVLCWCWFIQHAHHGLVQDDLCFCMHGLLHAVLTLLRLVFPAPAVSRLFSGTS